MVYLAAFGGEWVETADEKNKLGQWHFEISKSNLELVVVAWLTV